MTVVKRKNKIVIFLSIIIAVCLGMVIFIPNISAGASDVRVSASQLFPTNKIVLPEQSVDETLSGVFTNQNGVSVRSAVTSQLSTESRAFSFEYFKPVRVNSYNGAGGFSMTVGFDENWGVTSYTTNDTFSVILEIDATNYIEWKFVNTYSYNYPRVTMYYYVNGVYSSGGGASSTAVTLPQTSGSIGIEYNSSAGGFQAYAINSSGNKAYLSLYNSPSVPNADTVARNKEVFNSGEVKLLINHSKRGDAQEARRQMTVTVQNLCGINLASEATSEGILDKSAARVGVSANTAPDYIGGGDGSSALLPILLKYGQTNSLTFTVNTIYDLLATEDDMLLVVEDTYISDAGGKAVGKTYTHVKTDFVQNYNYNPYFEFGNTLPIGKHKISVGVQKRNGQKTLQDFYVDVVNKDGNFNLSPVINTGDFSGHVEYFNNITVPSFYATDFTGELIPAGNTSLMVTDPKGGTVSTVNQVYKPTLLGTYKYTYTAVDGYGNRHSEVRIVESVKNTSPIANGTIAPSIIYFKESTSGLLWDKEQAKSLFNDASGDMENMKITISVLKGGVSFANSNIFMPSEKATYEIIYTATDVANNSAMARFVLTLSNRAIAPKFTNTVNFGIPDDILFYKDYTSANTQEFPSIAPFIDDFDGTAYFISNPDRITLSIKDPDGIDATSDFNKPLSNRFSPKKEGRYTFTYTVRNSANLTATISFAVLVYAHTPVFNNTAAAFGDALPKEIALLQSDTLPTIQQSVVDDKYNEGVEFTMTVRNEAGAIVTHLVNGGVFSPATAGVHTITYTATNVAGKSAQITFTILVVAHAPKFQNAHNFGMPEYARFYLPGNYTAATTNKIPKMTNALLISKNLLWDFYGVDKVVITTQFTKQKDGVFVPLEAGEYSEESGGATYDSFRPNQTGLYAFTYTFTNQANQSTSVTFNVLVLAYAPEFKNLEDFAASMPKTVDFYIVYDTAVTQIPKFDETKYVDDIDLSNITVTTNISRPDGTTATATEYNFTTRLFKPAVEGHYVFTYVVTNGAGREISMSYVVIVVAHAPKFELPTLFTGAMPKALSYNVPIILPSMEGSYIIDYYGTVSGQIAPVILDENGVDVTFRDYILDSGTYYFKPSSIGSYTIIYRYTNVGGKTAEVSFSVFVNMQSPTIEFAQPNFWEQNITVECGTELTIPEAKAYDEMRRLISTLSATYEKPGTSEKYPWNVSQQKMQFTTLGSHVFKYTAIDSTGNEATAILTIKCVDTIAPKITIKDQIKDGDEFLIDSKNKEKTIKFFGHGVSGGWLSTDEGATPSIAGSGIKSATLVIICPNYPTSGWPVGPDGSFTIPVSNENAGKYTATYTVVDNAGNISIVRINFTIKKPPQIIRPTLPAEQLGNTYFLLPKPKLFDDYADSGFKIFCLITAPTGDPVAEYDMSAGDRQIKFDMAGKYTVTFFVRNDNGVESVPEVFEMMSMRGDPIFEENSRQEILALIATMQSEGVSMGKIYTFNEVFATDIFGIEGDYIVKIQLDFVDRNGSRTVLYSPTEDKNYRINFADESIYKMTFIIYSVAEDAPVQSQKGGIISFSDILRVSGNGEITFRYQGRVVVDFFDPATAPGNYTTGVRGTTLFAMPANRPILQSGAYGKVSYTLSFLKITAQGRINGRDTYPSVIIYIYGPGSSVDDDGVHFMDALEVRADGANPTFVATEIGWYTIIYEARDENGNIQRIQYRLNIIDETAPEFVDEDSFVKNLTEKTNSAEVNRTTTLPIPEVADNYDVAGNLIVSVQIHGPNGFFAEGFDFVPLFEGSHRIVYTITDASGRFVEKEFVFNVIPEVPPETPILGIAVGGIAGLTVMAGALYLVVYKNVFRFKKLVPKKG